MGKNSKAAESAYTTFWIYYDKQIECEFQFNNHIFQILEVLKRTKLKIIKKS